MRAVSMQISYRPQIVYYTDYTLNPHVGAVQEIKYAKLACQFQ